MSRLFLLKCLSPFRLIPGLRRRGIKGALLHGMRKSGALLDRALIGPYLIRINPLGAICNHACPMCWLQHLAPDELEAAKRADREQGMRLAEYVALLDSMPPGLQEVNIVGGGEPLARPDTVDLMAEIKRRRMTGSLISNGTLMKESVSRRMVEMGWDQTRISVHAADAETYRRIQGVDRFETLRANLKAFDRLRREAGAAGRCGLILFNVLQHENISAIPRLFEFAAEAGADFIVFEKIIPYDEAQWLSAEELRQARQSLAESARQSRVPCNLEDVLPQLETEEACAARHVPFRPAGRCSVGFDQAFIDSAGNVLPCCFSNEKMGNLREQSFGRIWRGERYRKFRRRLMGGQFPRYCIDNRCTMKGVLHE